jgi:outer membrane protein assembly factor BamB
MTKWCAKMTNDQIPMTKKRSLRYLVIGAWSLVLLAAIGSLAGAAFGADNWDRFRGPNGAGQSDAAGIPSLWSESDFLWEQPLPGAGHSSPVVWGDRLFVTSADPATAEQIILAFDALSGEPLWERRAASAPYPMHHDNSYATSTPAVDADQLYVLWLAGERVTMAAFTHDGDKVWQRDVGRLSEKHGFGTSPIVVGDVVVIANETDEAADSAVVGLDRKTGKVRWTVPRGTGKTAYATPMVWESPEGRELVLASSMGSGLTAYEPASGEVVWQCLENDLPDRCISSPIAAAGLFIVSCGSGNNGLHMIAMRPGEGNEPPVEAYRIREGVPNVPTPIVAGDLLFLWHDRGTVSCFNAATGERYWRERVGGKFHSSPLRIGDRIFCISVDGEVVVLAADKEFQEIARSQLDELCQATPAVAHDRLYVRAGSSLMCIGSPQVD